MAGLIRELNRITAGRVRYALMNGFPTFEATDEGDLIGREQYLIRAFDVLRFQQESMPPPLIVGQSLKIVLRRAMPGNPALITRNLSFKPLSPDLCGDPMNQFPQLRALTPNPYDDHYVVDIMYSIARKGELKEDQGQVFSHSVTSAGEFIAINPNKTDIDKTTDATDAPIMGTQALTVEDNADALMPFTLTVPELQHSFRRQYVIDPPWLTIYRMLGKVNAASYDFLELSAEGEFATADKRDPVEPETFMFVGVSGTQKTVFARTTETVSIGDDDLETGTFQLIRVLPWEMEYQFLQKRVEEVVHCDDANAGQFGVPCKDGVPVVDNQGSPIIDGKTGQPILPDIRVLGHNHAYSPKEQKWVRLLRQGCDPLHEYDTSASEKGFPDMFLTSNQLRARRGQSAVNIPDPDA